MHSPYIRDVRLASVLLADHVKPSWGFCTMKRARANSATGLCRRTRATKVASIAEWALREQRVKVSNPKAYCNCPAPQLRRNPKAGSSGRVSCILILLCIMRERRPSPVPENAPMRHSGGCWKQSKPDRPPADPSASRSPMLASFCQKRGRFDSCAPWPRGKPLLHVSGTRTPIFAGCAAARHVFLLLLGHCSPTP